MSTWFASSVFVHSSHPPVWARGEEGKKPIALCPPLALSLSYVGRVGTRIKSVLSALLNLRSNARISRGAFTPSHFTYPNWVPKLSGECLHASSMASGEAFPKDSLSILVSTLPPRVVSFSDWLCRHPEVVVLWLAWNSGIKTLPAYLPPMNPASFSAKLYGGDVYYLILAIFL